ncbi:ARM repeat superfamily protein [Forsythia ovata]|uniref:ARM repeat superfamily protein n=1 Tax=Forsythia ovata TaxID=205694 RepID=A0ABD1QP35_9LAMI
MVEDGGQNLVANNLSGEEWLSRAQRLVPRALEKAMEVKGFPGRWKPPCFSKNALCKEHLQAVSRTLNEAVELAECCVKEKFEGKLRMQSDLDSLSGKLDLNLRDCGLLIKTGVLGEVSLPWAEQEAAADHGNIRELLARLQIGHLETKHKALIAL